MFLLGIGSVIEGDIKEHSLEKEGNKMCKGKRR
jgi:hypothetical protein